MLDHPIDNNAFRIPRWGGVVISNPQTTNNSYKITVEELKPIIEIFTGVCKKKIGQINLLISTQPVFQMSHDIYHLKP